VQTDYQHNRKPRFNTAIGLLVLCLFLFPAPGAGASQAAPDPRPETPPYFYDPSGVFDEGQHRTLARDGKLLQSSDIPTIVYVRSTTAEDADPDVARAFAERVRRDWTVETTTGADDGLVLLYSHVPDNPQASTFVASWGPTAFDGNGLTPEYIESVLAGDVRALLDQGHPFEALVYGMRQIRYGGIYFPPSPEPLEGVTQTLHTTLKWVAPLLLVGVVSTYTVMSIRLTHLRAMPQHLVWTITGATGILFVLIAVASVIGRSRIGIVSALLILIALAIQTWLWNHPAKRPSRALRWRSVPPTSRRMRRAAQARRMHALTEGRH
jgi:hypothetical protein